MHWNLWLGFVAAAFVIGVIPGPAVTSIVGYALGSGRKTALASVAGRRRRADRPGVATAVVQN